MDWIKVKNVHVPASMTDAELGKLVKFQLEVARLERPLTEREKCAFFGRKEAQKSWENVKEKHQICEESITKKVLEDCESVAKLRQKNKRNKQNSRLDKETVTGDKVHSVTEQIREDKIREDKKEEKSVKKEPENTESVYLSPKVESGQNSIEVISPEKLEPAKPATQPRKKFQKPGRQSVLEYFALRTSEVGSRIDRYAEAERFSNYYESNGWKVGKNPMKDWHAAARNWIASAEEKLSRPSSRPENKTMQEVFDAL